MDTVKMKTREGSGCVDVDTLKAGTSLETGTHVPNKLVQPKDPLLGTFLTVRHLVTF